MSERQFPNIRLLANSFKGYYFGAFENTKINAKKGYDFFISHTDQKKDWCECLGFVHGKLCYHIKEAKKIFEVSTK